MGVKGECGSWSSYTALNGIIYCQWTFQRAHFQERLFILQKVPVPWYWYSSDTCLLMEKGSGGKVRSFFPKGETRLAVTEEQQGSS